MPELPPSADFSEANSTEIVAQRLQAPRRRLPRFLTALVRHLHDLDQGNTTDAGRMARGHRVPDRSRPRQRREAAGMDSSLRPSRRLGTGRGDQFPRRQGATPNTVRGPFYPRTRPTCRSAPIISLDRVGERLTVNGVVKRPRRRAGRGRRGGDLAGQRQGHLREPAARTCSRSSICAASSSPMLPGASTIRRSGRPATACRTTDRSASFCGAPAYRFAARHISIS